jgi:hypothetical protein
MDYSRTKWFIGLITVAAWGLSPAAHALTAPGLPDEAVDELHFDLNGTNGRDKVFPTICSQPNQQEDTLGCFDPVFPGGLCSIIVPANNQGGTASCSFTDSYSSPGYWYWETTITNGSQTDAINLEFAFLAQPLHGLAPICSGNLSLPAGQWIKFRVIVNDGSLESRDWIWEVQGSGVLAQTLKVDTSVGERATIVSGEPPGDCDTEKSFRASQSDSKEIMDAAPLRERGQGKLRFRLRRGRRG